MERKRILIILAVIGIIGALIPTFYYIMFTEEEEATLQDDLEAVDIESFEITLSDDSYNLELDIWIRGFDTERIDYRMEALIEGLIPVTQIYNYDHETLYTISPDEDLDITDLFGGEPETGIEQEDLNYEKEEGLTVENLLEERSELLKLLIAFGFWAEDHEIGKHELEVENGVFNIILHGKNRGLPDNMFIPPENAEFN